MFLANASTQRPIAMSCLLIALIALGLNSYRKISIEDMPAVDIPNISVITQWVGASPEDVEKDVSKHIEDAVSGIDGLKHIESSSLENVSQVVLEFNMSVDIDVAAQDVLVCSTGLIGERLPMEPLLAGVTAATQQLAASEAADASASRAIMTTDSVPKTAQVTTDSGVVAPDALDWNELYPGATATGNIVLPDDWRVNLDDALIDRLREWLKPENVEVVY